MKKKTRPTEEPRTIADFSLRQIADSLASALVDLTGKVYEVEVLALDRRPKGELSADLVEIADLRIRIREHHEDGADIDDTQPRRTLGS